MSVYFFFSSRRRHTRCSRDWSSDVCSSDLGAEVASSDGQLRHAQRAARASVAEEASPLCMPLCADQFQLAEFGGVSEAVSDWALLTGHLGPPLFLLSRISELSSPCRVRFAAQHRRALDRCGPF